MNLLNHPLSRWAEREPLVIAQARAIDADVYAFQEVDAPSDQVERLRLAFGDEYTSVVFANPDPTSIKSLAIVTRLPVSGTDECAALEQDDIALRVVVDADGRSVGITTTHFHYEVGRAGSECRRRQAEQLLGWLDGRGESEVLVGDFNSQPAGGAYATLTRRFDSAHAVARGGEPECTHPTDLIRVLDIEAMYGTPLPAVVPCHTVDYVFVDGGIDVVDCRVAWDEPSPTEAQLFPSDHYGLVADLRLR